MPALQCPTCAVWLTHNEAKRGDCSVCGSSLHNDERAKHNRPVSDASVPMTRTAVADGRQPPAYYKWLITAIGWVSLVMGVLCFGLGIVLTIIAAFAGLLYSSGVGRQSPNAFLPSLSNVLIVVAVCWLLIGASGIIAAIGVLLRRQWGRILMLVLGVPIVVIGCVCLISGEIGGVLWGIVLILGAVGICFVLIMGGSEFAKKPPHSLHR